MALSQAAAKAEQAIGHGDNATTAQDVTNPGRDRAKYGDPTENMKALAWMGKNTVQMVDCPKPKIIEDRDVILKITGSTVCGSDLHLLHGSVVELEKGDILGHEFCGIVDQVGPGVKNVKPGDRVVASFQIACGDCYFCQQKMSSQCEKTNSNTIENAMYGGRTAGMFGYSHFTGGFAGGQAEYTRVPYGDVNLLKLPDDVPDEKGLYLSDVVATSWNCVVDTGVKEGDVVAVWGAGPIGQMAADFSFLRGARRVIVIDQNWRLDYVKQKYPRVETLDFSSLKGTKAVVAKLKEMVDGRGPDVALECVAGEYPKGWLHAIEIATGLETDTSEILNEMIESVRNFGSVGITGVYVGYTNHFNIGSLMERGIRFIGNGQAPVHRYWEDLLKKIQSGEIDPLKMVTHRVRVEDLDKVYAKFDKKEDGMQKVFVQTRFSAPPCADQRLNPSASLHIREGRLRILKRHAAGDQAPHVDLAAGHEPDGQFVVALLVPEAALDDQLFVAHQADGERDVRLAVARLHVRPAAARHVDADLDAGLRARRVDRHVGAEPEVRGGDDAARALLGGLALRDDRVRGGVGLGERQPLLVDVDTDDLGRAEGSCDRAAQDADGAGAEDAGGR
nr:s-(hydroxymethyl)glutathione dehydrogenase [Quercus suber]